MVADLLPEILVTLLLVVLNGFFVGAEFAIVKVRQSQIDLLILVKSSDRGDGIAYFYIEIEDGAPISF
jgi:CBS domain containing-hemolysin-like protein